MDNMNKERNLIKIIQDIGKLLEKKPQNTTVLAIYREAFNENDDIELFKKRKLAIDEIEIAFESTQKTESMKNTIKDVSKALSFPNILTNKDAIRGLFTHSHISSIEILLETRGVKYNFKEIEELTQINDELKDELKKESNYSSNDLGIEVLKEISSDVDKAIKEYEIRGDVVILELVETIVGKLTIRKDSLSSIKNKTILMKLRDIFKLIWNTYKDINAIYSLPELPEKVTNIANYIGGLIGN